MRIIWRPDVKFKMVVRDGIRYRLPIAKDSKMLCPDSVRAAIDKGEAMRLMREDEYEPLRMNYKYGPAPDSKISAQRYMERKKPKRKKAKKLNKETP